MSSCPTAWSSPPRAGHNGSRPSGDQRRTEPPGLLMPDVITGRVKQAPQYAGLIQRRLAVPHQVDEGAPGGLSGLVRCPTSHLVAPPSTGLPARWAAGQQPPVKCPPTLQCSCYARGNEQPPCSPS
jgi:hypothetical protein